MTRLFRERLLKYGFYTLLVFFLYVLQTTPGLLAVSGVKPLLVLPACIAISLYEGAFTGGLFGFFFGFLCDTGSETLFGFSALFFLVFCTAVGLLSTYALRRSLLNGMLLCLTALFLLLGAEFFFSYVLYNYEGLSLFFYLGIAPQIVYSSLFSIPFCLLFERLHDLFARREEL